MDQTTVGHGFLLAANLTNSMQNLPDLPHTLALWIMEERWVKVFYSYWKTLRRSQTILLFCEKGLNFLFVLILWAMFINMISSVPVFEKSAKENDGPRRDSFFCTKSGFSFLWLLLTMLFTSLKKALDECTYTLVRVIFANTTVPTVAWKECAGLLQELFCLFFFSFFKKRNDDSFISASLLGADSQRKPEEANPQVSNLPISSQIFCVQDIQKMI